jgi:phospholipase/lecithinase/hemolysin
MSVFAKSCVAALLATVLTLRLSGISAVAADVPAHPTGIVVFVDSLSDRGNAFAASLHTEPPSPPYFDGRFSNGPVWVELFAREFGLEAGPAAGGGTNYAVGGAKTGSGPDSLKNQATAFLVLQGLSELSRDDLFVVFGGGNDLNDALDSLDPAGVVADAAANIRDIIEDLAARGAVNFLVPNLPNKGLTPAARGRGTPREEQTLSIAFNMALNAVLDDVGPRLGVNVIRVNLFDLAQHVVAMPAAFGFSNVTDPCLVEDPGFTVCDAPGSYIFWDDIHPTGRAHELIAGAAIAAYRLTVVADAGADGTAETGARHSPSFAQELIDNVKREIDRIVPRAFR